MKDLLYSLRQAHEGLKQVLASTDFPKVLAEEEDERQADIDTLRETERRLNLMRATIALSDSDITHKDLSTKSSDHSWGRPDGEMSQDDQKCVYCRARRSEMDD